ncbi:hypothetical protein M8J76_001730 [Diaphorina citri]|nr:hypothetical protein M8J76_001730 [Diaphorina citri]
MACLYSNNSKINTHITSYEIKDKIALYKITVQVGEVCWSLSHRYSDFVELNDKLVKDHSLNKDLLPPKKVLRNLDPTFLEKRKTDLEIYLQNVVNFLEKSLPRCLIDFLHLVKYDINILLQDFASFCFNEGDKYLSMGNSTHAFNPLQLYAINNRLKQECPAEESLHQEHDFCHILEFCNNLRTLIIQGSPSHIGTSNITYNQLSYELAMFKKLCKLFLYNVDINNVTNLGTLRNELEKLTVCKSSNIKSPCDILLCDQVHKTINPDLIWTQLTQLDLSANEITHLDEAMSLVPHLEELNLESNQIKTISNLKSLTKLKRLNLNRNRIQDLSHFKSELNSESIVELNVCENLITNLNGLDGMENLQSLDLGSNFISDLSEISNISCLDQLTNINLTGNPIATIIDYRIKILQLFFKRANQIVLDSEKPTSKEIDCTNILNALLVNVQFSD